MTAVQTTSLNRSWLLKMGAFLVLLAGFGTWALVDGLVIFPRRGELDASYKLYQYLESARDAGRLTRENVQVENPRQTLAELESKESDLRRAAQGAGIIGGGLSPRVAAMEVARLEWLRSLQRVWRLDTAPSRINDDVSAQLSELTATWKVNQPPKPLAGMDLMFQWVFMALGYGGALWIGVVVLRAKGKVFTWDPAEHRLTLPDGLSIVPADVAEFDKRKWHKYYITLALKNGQSRTLDLLRYVPLEQWVLAMEAVANPEAAQAQSGAAEAGEASDSAAQPSQSDPAPQAAGSPTPTA